MPDLAHADPDRCLGVVAMRIAAMLEGTVRSPGGNKQEGNSVLQDGVDD
jgi:hypothetical protein